MNPTEKSNGNGGAGTMASAPVDRLVLTLTRNPWRLEVSGQVENNDLAHAMLDQALRAIDQKLRWEGAQQLKAQLEEQAKNQAIAASLRNGGRG